MSAFLCTNRHLCILVTYASDESVTYVDWRGSRQTVKDREQYVMQKLRTQNILSMEARYPNEKFTDAERRPVFIRAFPLERDDPDYVALQIIKNCACYSYQACETDDYELTEARRIIAAIAECAGASLWSMKEAPWGFAEFGSEKADKRQKAA